MNKHKHRITPKLHLMLGAMILSWTFAAVMYGNLERHSSNERTYQTQHVEKAPPKAIAAK